MDLFVVSAHLFIFIKNYTKNRNITKLYSYINFKILKPKIICSNYNKLAI